MLCRRRQLSGSVLTIGDPAYSAQGLATTWSQVRLWEARTPAWPEHAPGSPGGCSGCCWNADK